MADEARDCSSHVRAMAYTATNYSVLRLVALRGVNSETMITCARLSIIRYIIISVSHDGIVSLQVKCHDLKHQIKAIRSQIGKENLKSISIDFRIPLMNTEQWLTAAMKPSMWF